jgi:hypothetical protein
MNIHVRWVPSYHGMAHPQDADGAHGLSLWRVAANVFSKQLQTANNGRYYSFGAGHGANKFSP